jgi:hypothetical protein
MRYENQNPQYIYLLEKIEEQEKVIARLRNDMGYLLNKYEEKAEAHHQLRVSIIKFNFLSPFKKMFYKFDI